MTADNKGYILLEGYDKDKAPRYFATNILPVLDTLYRVDGMTQDDYTTLIRGWEAADKDRPELGYYDTWQRVVDTLLFTEHRTGRVSKLRIQEDELYLWPVERTADE